MVTKLDGPSTDFLPFNKGNGGGKGNPAEPRGRPPHGLPLGSRSGRAKAGSRSWGATCSRRRDEKKQLKGMIFPRYHQLDVTRKLQAAVLAQGRAGRAAST